MRSQHRGLPGASSVAYPLTDLVTKHVGGRWERRASGTVTPHRQHLPEPIRDRKDPILAVLRVFGAEDHLPAWKRYVAPPQSEQFALPTAGLKGGDDHCLKVWPGRAQQLVLLAWLQPSVALRFFLAMNDV